MGRERFLFLPFPLPCGSALWDPDLTGRKSWRYSPECVEVEFCELRLDGVLGSKHGPGPRLILPTGTHYGLSWSGLSGERLRVPQDLVARSASKC